MAQLWKLPVIYVIENNRYAMGTAVSRASAQTDFSQRGASFGIPGLQVDGMDVRAVKAAADEATAHCRAGNGPIILEMLTYRYRGHSMSDPAKYRSKDEVQKMRSEHDPIEQVRLRLVEKGWASEEDLKLIDKDVATSSLTVPISLRPIRSRMYPSSTPTSCFDPGGTLCLSIS